MLPEHLDTEDIAHDLGVELDTVRTYLKRARRNRQAGNPRPGDLPEPDAPPRGGRPRWKRSTYLAWKQNRPGRGAGGGRPPSASPTGTGATP